MLLQVSRLLILATVGNEREKAVIANLDRVNVEHTLGRRDEAEVDGMSERPDLPAAEYLTWISNASKWVAVTRERSLFGGASANLC